MPTVYLSPSAQSKNVGYGDYGTERERCEQIAAETRTLLIRWGVGVKWPTADDMTERVKEANAQGVDLYLPIHTNAGGGRGCEVLVLDKYATGSKPYASESKRFAQILYGRISAITPSSDRGVKTDVYNFYEIREPKCPCAYLETAFHDDPKDAEFIINNVPVIAREIALSICDYFGIKPKSDDPEDEGRTYRLSIGEYKVRETAEAVAQRLINDGYAPKLVIEEQYQTVQKPIEEIAREVIAGRWGNGAERKQRLESAGYDYAQVQAAVNKIL